MILLSDNKRNCTIEGRGNEYRYTKTTAGGLLGWFGSFTTLGLARFSFDFSLALRTFFLNIPKN